MAKPSAAVLEGKETGAYQRGMSLEMQFRDTQVSKAKLEQEQRELEATAVRKPSPPSLETSATDLDPGTGAPQTPPEGEESKTAGENPPPARPGDGPEMSKFHAKLITLKQNMPLYEAAYKKWQRYEASKTRVEDAKEEIWRREIALQARINLQHLVTLLHTQVDLDRAGRKQLADEAAEVEKNAWYGPSTFVEPIPDATFEGLLGPSMVAVGDAVAYFAKATPPVALATTHHADSPVSMAASGDAVACVAVPLEAAPPVALATTPHADSPVSTPSVSTTVTWRRIGDPGPVTCEVPAEPSATVCQRGGFLTHIAVSKNKLRWTTLEGPEKGTCGTFALNLDDVPVTTVACDYRGEYIAVATTEHVTWVLEIATGELMPLDLGDDDGDQVEPGASASSADTVEIKNFDVKKLTWSPCGHRLAVLGQPSEQQVVGAEDRWGGASEAKADPGTSELRVMVHDVVETRDRHSKWRNSKEPCFQASVPQDAVDIAFSPAGNVFAVATTTAIFIYRWMEGDPGHAGDPWSPPANMDPEPYKLEGVPGGIQAMEWTHKGLMLLIEGVGIQAFHMPAYCAVHMS